MSKKNEIITESVERNHDYYRQDHSVINAEDSGIADRLLKNDRLYRAMKGDWERTDWSGSGVTKITTGRRDGKFFITREQTNIEAIKEGVKRYRALAEAGVPDPLAPIGPDGQLQWSWVSLPKVIAQRISDNYFGGMPWDTVKRDRTLKAQWYRVIQAEYPEYITYPGGRLPIPIDVPYPSKVGEKKFFKGN
jgi:hypothetical protein